MQDFTDSLPKITQYYCQDWKVFAVNVNELTLNTSSSVAANGLVVFIKSSSYTHSLSSLVFCSVLLITLALKLKLKYHVGARELHILREIKLRDLL